MPVAFFDLDKTIYDSHSFFAVARAMVVAGKASEHFWSLTQELLQAHKSGATSYQDTANKLLEAFASELRGQSYAELLTDAQNFFSEHENNFYPYFAQILPELQKTHAVFLVTTNVQFVAEAVVRKYGLQGYISTELEIVDGILTGKVARSLANGKEMVRDLLDTYGRKDSLAVGDSANDISMLELVDNPLCINPDAELRAHAEKNGWKIFSDGEAKGMLRKSVLFNDKSS